MLRLKKLKSTNLAWLPVMMLILSMLACAQDCMGTTFSVRGHVFDLQGNPIPNATIKVWNEGSFERPAINFSVQTDTVGWFATDSGFSYGCTTFQVTVSAQGYETKTLTFYPPGGEGWPNQLPDEVTIQLSQINP